MKITPVLFNRPVVTFKSNKKPENITEYDDKRRCLVETHYRPDGTKSSEIRTYDERPDNLKIYEIYDIKGRLISRNTLQFSKIETRECFDARTGKCIYSNAWLGKELDNNNN